VSDKCTCFVDQLYDVSYCKLYRCLVSITNQPSTVVRKLKKHCNGLALGGQHSPWEKGILSWAGTTMGAVSDVAPVVVPRQIDYCNLLPNQSN